MAVPDFQSFFLPLLEMAADGQEHTLSEAYDCLAKSFDLSETDRRELLPSGRQLTYKNRIGWAKTYLSKAGLLEKPRKGAFSITDRGRKVFEKKPDNLNIRFLMSYPEFEQFHTSRPPLGVQGPSSAPDQPPKDPDEVLEQAYLAIRDDLASDLLDILMKSTPSFFEKLVVNVLVKMGYGGSLKEAGEAIGLTGDEGIDGIIKEDKLGLDIIYIQAKRWAFDHHVGRPEVQKFAGALQGKRAKKGIFLTTSVFSKEAVEYAAMIETKIILIDGEQLVNLMIDHNVGVSPVSSYELKKIDHDFFADPD